MIQSAMQSGLSRTGRRSRRRGVSGRGAAPPAIMALIITFLVSCLTVAAVVLVCFYAPCLRDHVMSAKREARARRRRNGQTAELATVAAELDRRRGVVNPLVPPDYTEDDEMRSGAPTAVPTQQRRGRPAARLCYSVTAGQLRIAGEPPPGYSAPQWSRQPAPRDWSQLDAGAWHQLDPALWLLHQTGWSPPAASGRDAPETAQDDPLPGSAHDDPPPGYSETELPLENSGEVSLAAAVSLGHQLPSPGHQLSSPDHLLPSPGHQLPSPGHQLPSPGHQLPSPGHQLPSMGHQLSQGDQLPSPGHQLPQGDQPTLSEVRFGPAVFHPQQGVAAASSLPREQPQPLSVLQFQRQWEQLGTAMVPDEPPPAYSPEDPHSSWHYTGACPSSGLPPGETGPVTAKSCRCQTVSNKLHWSDTALD